MIFVHELKERIDREYLETLESIEENLQEVFGKNDDIPYDLLLQAQQLYELWAFVNACSSWENELMDSILHYIVQGVFDIDIQPFLRSNITQDAIQTIPYQHWMHARFMEFFAMKDVMKQHGKECDQLGEKFYKALRKIEEAKKRNKTWK